MANQLEQSLHVIATYLREDIKQRLIDDGHTATGELVDSIKTVVSREVSMYVVNGYMAKQGIFIISGREKGAKGVPLEALQKWVENKPFSNGIDAKLLLKIESGKFEGFSPMAIISQRNIKLRGIKPNDFIGKSFDANRVFIGNSLHQAVSDQMHISIKNMINHAKQFAT